MTGVTLRGFRARKLRAVLTAIAIVLGVAMISGTYVLMDTTMHAFDNLFTTAYAKAGAVVVGRTPIAGTHVSAPPVAAALAARIRALPQVKDAQGYSTTRRRSATPQAARSTDPARRSRSACRRGQHAEHAQLVSGRFPSGPVKSRSTSGRPTRIISGWARGSESRLATRCSGSGRRPRALRRRAVAGPMQLLVFDLPVAQQMFDKQGLYDEIDVAARPGVSSQQLVRAIAPLLPATAQVKTGAEQVQDTTKHVEEGMAIVRYVLLAFGGIALFVGAFVIFNTLSVTVAQRTRELATLRTLGASRPQVLGSVVLEALVIGVLASLIGFVAVLWVCQSGRLDVRLNGQ